MQQEMPLSEEELAAVDDGIGAHEKLLSKLADVPTPSGPTPRELGREEPNGSSTAGSQTEEQPRTPLIPAESLLRKPSKNGKDGQK